MVKDRNPPGAANGIARAASQVAASFGRVEQAQRGGIPPVLKVLVARRCPRDSSLCLLSSQSGPAHQRREP